MNVKPSFLSLTQNDFLYSFERDKPLESQTEVAYDDQNFVFEGQPLEKEELYQNKSVKVLQSVEIVIPSQKRKQIDLENVAENSDELKKIKIPLTELEKAVQEKNIDEIKLILLWNSEKQIKKIIFHINNKKKLNPVHQAVLDRDIMFLQDLLNIPQMQPFINTPDKFLETPIFYAVKYKEIEMVALLLKNGADVRRVSSHKKTRYTMQLLIKMLTV